MQLIDGVFILVAHIDSTTRTAQGSFRK
jgi:hypothetical protein